MKIKFITSGFPNGFTDAFLHEIKKYWLDHSHFVFVASDFSVHEKTQRYMNAIVEEFRSNGLFFASIGLIDHEIHPSEAVSLIQQADIVWLAGGPTLIQIRDIQQYGLVDALRQREGITIGMSAGSINMASRVVVAKDIDDGIPTLSVYDGIGLTLVNIEPHLNLASEDHLKDVEDAGKITDIYGLYDESFIVDCDGDIEIYGPYRLFSYK